MSTPEPPVTGPPVTGPPVTGPPVVLRSFNLSGLPSQTEIELTDADTIAVPGLFGSGRPAGVALRVTATGGATAIGTSAALVVRAEALGDALVTLGVSAPGYRDTTATLAVRVVPSVCPPNPAAGARDYFPIEEGVTSRYTLEVFVRSERVSTEPLTATFQNVRCLRGFRRGMIRYTIPSRLPEDQPFAEDARNVIMFRSPALGSLSSQAVFERYSTTAPTVLAVPISVCSPAQSRFEAGIGFVREGAVCGGIGGFQGRAITRQP